MDGSRRQRKGFVKAIEHRVRRIEKVKKRRYTQRNWRQMDKDFATDLSVSAPHSRWTNVRWCIPSKTKYGYDTDSGLVSWGRLKKTLER